MRSKISKHKKNRSQEFSVAEQPGILARVWLKMAEKNGARNFTGFAISIFVHLAVISLYLGIHAFEQPEVIEIREISFVDMTEQPPVAKVKKKTRPKQQSIAIAQASIPETKPAKKPISVAVRSAKKVVNATPVVNLTRRLDMKRTQAPIQATPISLVKKPQAELLKISRAKGTSSDRKVLNPTAAPIKLKKAPSLARAFKGKKAPGIAFRGNKKINLAKRQKPSSTRSLAQNRAAFAAVFNPKTENVQIKKSKSGVTITGPLGSRRILSRTMPEFPDWAKRRGVGARIDLQFTVMENGHVKENIIVIQTSGSAEWDKIVRNALRKWRFVALNTGGRRDQTGVITFQFVVN